MVVAGFKGRFMMRKVLIFSSILLFSATLYTTPIFSGASAAGSQTYRQLDIFGDIFERIRSHYVESPDEEQLVRDAINGMLQALDPHSSYLDPKERDDIRVQTSGEFGGLGIEVTMEDDLVKVITPVGWHPCVEGWRISGRLH